MNDFRYTFADLYCREYQIRLTNIILNKFDYNYAC